MKCPPFKLRPLARVFLRLLCAPTRGRRAIPANRVLFLDLVLLSVSASLRLTVLPRRHTIPNIA